MFLRLAAALSLRFAKATDPLDWVESIVNRAWQRLEGRGLAPASCGLRSSSTFDPVGGSSNGRAWDL